MSKKYENVFDLWNYLQNEQKRGGPEVIMEIKNNFSTGASKLDSAMAGFLDILPELMESPKYHNVAEDIFNSIWYGGPKVNLSREDREYNNIRIKDVLTDGMPSHFEGNRAERKRHRFLLEHLQSEAIFGTTDIDKIANIIYSPYFVVKTGGLTNLVLSRKELNDRNLEEYDVRKSMRYFIYKKLQKGEEIHFNPTLTRKYGTGLQALDKIKRDILKVNPSGSIWPAVIRRGTGKGVEVVLMGGDRTNPANSRILGDLFTVDNNRQFKKIEYTEEEMWKVFGKWREGDFFDNENDPNLFGLAESTKTKMNNYYNEYSKTPPTHKNMGYFFTDFRDPGKYEWENFIKPFMEAKTNGISNKELSEDEFDKAWEKHRLTKTYTWEAQWLSENFRGIIDPYAPIHQGELPDFISNFLNKETGVSEEPDLQFLREKRDLELGRQSLDMEGQLGVESIID